MESLLGVSVPPWFHFFGTGMKAPLSWIQDYVDLGGHTPQQVADALRMAGVGIEGIEGDVLDLEITANRADLLSMMGVARECALVFGREFRVREDDSLTAVSGPAGLLKVSVENTELCPRYTGLRVRGVTVGPSPLWMQEKLTLAGIRPVNNVVDITNFVMLECGQPLHAFDWEKIRSHQIVVRPARTGEKIVAIDGREYALTPEMLVIADAERPVAIAGVMGGKETEISPATKYVVIESAQFDPVSVRRTSRRLGLSSESSYRFERGVDREGVLWASERAAELLSELAGGRRDPIPEDVGVPAPPVRTIQLRPVRVNRVLGMTIAPERMEKILLGLGCSVKKAGTAFEVGAPSKRRDIRVEADLIEEIIRIEGYDKVPSNPIFVQRAAVDRKDDLVREVCRETLLGTGAYEVCTWSFEEAGAPNRVTAWSSGELIPLRDPQGKVERTLRTSLAPEFLRVMARNESYQEPLHPIFEIASVYFRTSGGFGEKRLLAMASPKGGRGVKGMTEHLLARLGLPVRFEAIEAPWLRSGTGASLVVGCKSVGYLGEPVREFCEATGLGGEAGIAEVDFDALAVIAELAPRFREFSRRPPVDRDLAVIVDEKIPWGAVEDCVRQAAPEWLERVRFFDVYRGKPVPAGRKSLAFSMRFRAQDRTFTGPEIDAAVQAILEALQKGCGAVLRA